MPSVIVSREVIEILQKVHRIEKRLKSEDKVKDRRAAVVCRNDAVKEAL